MLTYRDYLCEVERRRDEMARVRAYQLEQQLLQKNSSSFGIVRWLRNRLSALRPNRVRIRRSSDQTIGKPARVDPRDALV